MQIKVVTKGRGDTCNATGLFDGTSLVVQKGSRVSASVSHKIH